MSAEPTKAERHFMGYLWSDHIPPPVSGYDDETDDETEAEGPLWGSVDIHIRSVDEVL